MELQAILDLNVEGLRGKLVELGLPTGGLKAKLRDRLRGHFGLNDDESGSVYDDVTSRQGAGADTFSRSMFTLRDIEDSLTLFSGTDNIEIRN